MKQADWDAMLVASANGDAAAQLQVAEAYLNFSGHKPVCESAAALLASPEACATDARVAGSNADAHRVPHEDAVEGVRWLLASAEAGGSPAAQLRLAQCYAAGLGVEKRSQSAVQWYRRAAESGLAEAQFELGNCYSSGDGVPQLMEEALQWYQKSAEGGLAAAQHQMGLCAAKGQGTRQSWAAAAKWFELAAAQGNVASQFSLGSIYSTGTGSISRDPKRAAQLYHAAAEQGHVRAQMSLAQAYMNGVGVPQDAKQGMHWHERAAEQGNAEAQNTLGVHYAFGLGVPRDFRMAARWCMKAAAQGFHNAQHTANWCQEQLLVQAGKLAPKDERSQKRSLRASKKAAASAATSRGAASSVEDSASARQAAEHMAALLLLEEEAEQNSRRAKESGKKARKSRASEPPRSAPVRRPKASAAGSSCQASASEESESSAASWGTADAHAKGSPAKPTYGSTCGLRGADQMQGVSPGGGLTLCKSAAEDGGTAKGAKEGKLAGAPGAAHSSNKSTKVLSDGSWILDEADSVLRQLVDEIAEEHASTDHEQAPRAAAAIRDSPPSVSASQKAASLKEMQQQSALVQSVVASAQAEMSAAVHRKDLTALRKVLHRVHSGYLQPFYRNRVLRKMLHEAEVMADNLAAGEMARRSISAAIVSEDEEALKGAIKNAEAANVSVKYARKVLKRLQRGALTSTVGEESARTVKKNEAGKSQIRNQHDCSLEGTSRGAVPAELSETTSVVETSETAEMSEATDTTAGDNPREHVCDMARLQEFLCHAQADLSLGEQRCTSNPEPEEREDEFSNRTQQCKACEDVGVVAPRQEGCMVQECSQENNTPAIPHAHTATHNLTASSRTPAASTEQHCIRRADESPADAYDGHPMHGARGCCTPADTFQVVSLPNSKKPVNPDPETSSPGHSESFGISSQSPASDHPVTIFSTQDTEVISDTRCSDESTDRHEVHEGSSSNSVALTRVCKFFVRGICRYGFDCRNSHDINDMDAKELHQYKQNNSIAASHMAAQGDARMHSRGHGHQQAMIAAIHPVVAPQGSFPGGPYLAW
eukprot:CAMPEP_0114319262 /NCGR_PEP_ID=MMETSP0059-20121206/25142_1 /TAXON_ID=36894 /ORGANISM="Pyramimonas parkeae, Strain CCMP726" /LENGTH=1052 /DNA_ID=CAMNT_0001446247 /DNA_START=348 /DNA_END=3503 /DNA_ORIENTATION=-